MRGWGRKQTKTCEGRGPLRPWTVSEKAVRPPLYSARLNNLSSDPKIKQRPTAKTIRKFIFLFFVIN